MAGVSPLDQVGYDRGMPGKGIKVKELARQTGVTSRQIIDRCRAEGIPVQNSITKLTPQVERTVRVWFDPSQISEGERSEDRPGNP